MLVGVNPERLLVPDRSREYLATIGRRVVVFDGAMGVTIQSLNLGKEHFEGRDGPMEILVATRPDVIEGIHASFLEVGADVVETNSFQGSRLKLDEWGLGDRTHELNYAAARLARRVCDRFATSDRPRWVAGSVGPTGFLPSSSDPALADITFERLAEVFYEQAKALAKGGCDLLLVETGQDILELKAAVVGINRLFRDLGQRLPLQVQVTLDTSGRMLLGTDVAAAMATLQALPVDIIGMNCSTGPEHMYEPIRYLCEHSRLPLSCIPNAGLPLNQGGRAVYPLEPEPMANALGDFALEFGVEIVGGCCGTTPEHIRQIVARVGGKQPRRRNPAGEPLVSSSMRATSLVQIPPPTLIGERVNTQGSRKVKRLVLSEDYDGVLDVARDQVDGGAHLLDICVALTERTDEVQQMREIVRKLSMGVDAPLMIDSTEHQVIAEALRAYPGRAVVNSINLESGLDRIRSVMPHVVELGAAVVALTIDEAGMAKTAARKREVASRIYEICVNDYGLPPDALIFDALTFTLATGEEEFRQSAAETIEGIRAIKRALPGALTSLGVSNVSFGLAPHARAVLNSVFLYHCVQAGLDMAIVNPSQITPYAEISADQRELAEHLIFNRLPDALARFIDYFERHEVVSDLTRAATDPSDGMAIEEKIHWQILHRRKEGIEGLLDDALKSRGPVDLLNNVLLPAMKDVGDRFGAGELILPFVLQSAEVMKRAVAHLEHFLERREGTTKGTLVLATVFGDVHDIGKNLVDTILSNNGYQVINLGKQVPVNVIIEAAVEHRATAIGLSALLVSTSKQMPLCVNELARRNLQIPVIVGGASINRNFGYRMLSLENGQAYGPGVFYAKDAFEGLEIMDKLVDPKIRPSFRAKIQAEAERALARRAELIEQQAKAVATAASATARGSSVRTDVDVPAPPFWGHRVVRDVPLGDIIECIDRNALFRLQWGGKGVHGEEWARLVAAEFEPRLARMATEAEQRGYLVPAVVYGYYPCQSDGNDLVVYDPSDGKSVLTKFSFPRQPDRDHLCLADYFAAVDSGRMDVVVLQVVTTGPRATELVERLQGAGDYSEAFFIHGLSVQCAEALAEWTNRRVRRELGVDDSRCLRYSWGYPACPDLEEHKNLFRVLPVCDTIGVSLTEAFQLVPEQSTAALVVHHPEAHYFSTRPLATMSLDQAKGR